MLLHNYFLCAYSVSQSSPALCDLGTLVCQALLSMGFSRQEYWSGLPLPSARGLELDSGDSLEASREWWKDSVGMCMLSHFSCV